MVRNTESNIDLSNVNHRRDIKDCKLPEIRDDERRTSPFVSLLTSVPNEAHIPSPAPDIGPSLEAPAKDARACIACGAHAPATSGESTLISVRFGWRLVRETVDGRSRLVWRCARCWKVHRAQQRPSWIEQ
jgi:hypothetical protein